MYYLYIDSLSCCWESMLCISIIWLVLFVLIEKCVNAFKQEAPHLIPKLSRDGGKFGIPEEVDE